jgi:hypothetical protein
MNASYVDDASEKGRCLNAIALQNAVSRCPCFSRPPRYLRERKPSLPHADRVPGRPDEREPFLSRSAESHPVQGVCALVSRLPEPSLQRELGSQLVCKAHKKFEGSTVGEKHNTGEHLIREVFPDSLLFFRFREPLGRRSERATTFGAWFVGTSVSRVGYETPPGVHDGCRCTVASHVIRIG